MRNISIFLAAAALIAAPSAAQNTTAADANAIGMADTGATDAANAAGNAPTNGLTAGPGTPVAAADPAAVPPTMGEQGFVTKERDRFPWGLLGALGLLGLLGRKRRRDDDRDDRPTGSS